MNKNDKWNDYSNEELLEMLRKIVQQYGDIDNHYFTKYGLPHIRTYAKRFNLESTSKKLLFELANIKIQKPEPINTRICNGSENKIITDLPMYLSEKGTNANKLVIDWKNTVGMDVELLYKNEVCIITILSYDKKMRCVEVKYLDDNPFKISIDQLRTGKFGRLLKKTRNKEYKYNVGDIIKNEKLEIKIIKQIRMKHGVSTIRGYEYECLKCGNTDKIDEYNLSNNKGCNVCGTSCKKVNENYNSVWATNPELVNLFVNIEDSKTLSIASGKKKIWLKCPRCGNLKYTTMNNIYQRVLNGYFPCDRCSDKKSYPEKFLFSILCQLGIDFEIEKTFIWSKNISHDIAKLCGNKRYDFYFEYNNEKYILETHGLQHYEETNIGKGKGRNYYEELQNDNLKKTLSLSNGFSKDTFMVIDCRKSELEWIKQHVLKSNLAIIFDLNKIDWLKCHEYAVSSLVKLVCDLWNSGYKSTMEIEKITKIKNHRVCRYLKQGKELNMCDYDAKKAMQEGFERGQKNSTIACSMPLICLDDLSVFSSINDCERKSKDIYGLTMWHERLGKACLNKTNYRGYNFRFIRDLTDDEILKYDIENILINNKQKE